MGNKVDKSGAEQGVSIKWKKQFQELLENVTVITNCLGSVRGIGQSAGYLVDL